jgi:hypothetical protein
MKRRVLTATLLFLCGLVIGWAAYQNLMWAVWGKQNAWFEYLGFWGCPVMIAGGIVALKSLRVGSILGLIGFILMLFYLGPAVVKVFQAIAIGWVVINAKTTFLLMLTIVLPLLTLGMLTLNTVKKGS